MKSLVCSIAIFGLFRFALCAAETPPAAITIKSPDAVEVLTLESGQPRLYDSKPLRVIEKVTEKLTGWQFTSIPQRIVNSYKIHVNKTGVIYAFGGGSSKKPPTREHFLGGDSSQWIEEAGAIQGPNIPMCFSRKVTAGETLSLDAFELQLAAESIALESNVDVKAGSAQSPSEILALEAPNAIEWALAPLDRRVPGDIRQNLTMLRENLLDEAAKKPVVNAAAYKLAEELCNDLLDTLNERDKARVRAGYTAVQAKVNMGEITNQALEARRSSFSIPRGGSSPNWPTYQREKDQREELRKQKENGAALENQRPILEWADRGAQLRRILDSVYAQYREAARRPVASK